MSSTEDQDSSIMDTTKSNGTTDEPKPPKRRNLFTRRSRAREAAWSASAALPPSVQLKEHTLKHKTDLLRSMVEGNHVDAARWMVDNLLSDEQERNLGLADFTIQDISGNGLLQMAALHSFDVMTTMLLNKGFNINNIDNNHGTALQAAIYMNNKMTFDILLGRTKQSKGGPANVDTIGGYYGCAMQVAAFKGSEYMITSLLARGANVNLCVGKSKYGTSLQAAARTGLPSIVKLILDLTSDVDAEGVAYGTALQAAAKGSYTDATTYLRQISRGRVLTHATKCPRKADLSPADYTKVAELLLDRGAKADKPGGRLESPINAAASSGDYAMLELLLKAQVDQQNFPRENERLNERKKLYGRALLSAITSRTSNNNRLKLVRLLIDHGADVNFEAGSCLHNKPLTAAAAMNDKDVVEEILNFSKDKVSMMNAESGIFGSALRAALSARPDAAKDTALYLIGEGTDLQQGDESYGNILHLAAFANLSEVVEKLISDYNMKVDTLDWNGQTALHVAAYRGFEVVVNVLLKYNADAGLKDVWGHTALDIVEHTMDKASHPGPDLVDLKGIKQSLSKHLAERKKISQNQANNPFRGPPTTKKTENSNPMQGKAKPVFESPTWNPGLHFNATVIDFLERDDQEYVLVKELSTDDLLYRKGATEEIMTLPDTSTQKESKDQQENCYKKNLRWIHLPTNNMTWAEMLMKILWAEAHPNTTCKSFWGTDPYFVSPDLSPHARFVTPQCERLINDSMNNPTAPSESSCEPMDTMFLAMPYIHWESDRAQRDVRKLLNDIKEDAAAKRILNRGRTWRTNENCKPIASPRREISDSLQRKVQLPSLPTNVKADDLDDDLLKKYLFKRWPLHLRRTLDQYYYSYLADTETRDGDQVVMRIRNLHLKCKEDSNAADIDKIERGITREVGQMQSPRATSNVADTKKRVVRRDDNSPIVMVDQLWLWVVKKDLVVTCFPQRRSNKYSNDLDPEDRTDVLKTLISYLHSAKRHPVQHAYDLCELIVSQTVGILHRSDMIPDLDFLKIFATQADTAIDEVMKRLKSFVDKHEEFVAWLDEKHHNAGQYVKKFEETFSVTHETYLLREIQDMKDELNMLAAVFIDQVTVLGKTGLQIARDRAKLNKTKSSEFNFEQQSQKHSRHVERMKKQASQAYDNLKDLLELKQQQANVLEARVSRNQAIASKRTGKTVMVFTIVTIIFLPLTFMTTIFTLPVIGLPRFDPDNLEPKSDGQLKPNYVSGWITGFTLVLALPLIIAAFKIEHLEWCWATIKKGRIKVFPLHRMGKKGIPPLKEGDEPVQWIHVPFYYGGPLPRRHTTIDDL